LPALYALSLTYLTLTSLAILALISLILATSTAAAPATLGVRERCGCQKQDAQGAAHLY
jgi:hypothetical protein